MQVKRFEGTNIQDVLRSVKQELGPSAIILSTREIKKGTGAYGMFSRTMVEVTAAIDQDVEPHTPLPEAPVTSTQPVLPGANHTATQMVRAMEPLQRDVNDLKELMRQLVAQERLQTQPNAAGLEREFAAVKKMVEYLVRGQQDSKSPLFPTAIMPFYQRLLSSGIGDELARHLIEKMLNSLDAEQYGQEQYVLTSLANMIVKLTVAGGPLKLTSGAPTIAAFVGPTGVGKTTTIAKLAAHYTFSEKKHVALVTIDTYRIAAVEQLRTFAKIIGLPLDVVISEAELDQALKKYHDMDLILIDTAGRSQRDQLQMSELESFFSKIKRADVHLVASATSSTENLHETVERFNSLSPKSMIFTKLDECNRYGNIFRTNRQSQLPISYFTTGQQVPEDIEIATPERLVDLILNISQQLALETA